MASLIERFRQKNGGLTDLSDDDIAEFLHQKYASDTSYDDFKAFAGRESPEEQAGALRSYGLIPLLKGVTDVGGAVGYGLEASGIAPEFGKDVQQSALETEQRLTERQSLQAQEDAKQRLINPDGSLGDYNFGTFVQQAGRSLPGMFVMGVPGGILAKGATTAAKALGAGAKSKFIGSSVGYGASEGVFSGASNAAQEQQTIRNTPFDKLVDNPAFVEAYHNETDPEADQNTRLEQARDIMARRAGDEVFGRTAATTGAIGAVTGGGLLGQMRTGATGGRLMRATKGIAKEAGQEAPQSGFEQYHQNVAEQKYLDPNTDPYKDVLNATVEGGLVGGAMGLGGVFSPSREAQQVDKQIHALTDAEVGVKFAESQTVDGAIDTAFAALEPSSAPIEDAILTRANDLVDLPELGAEPVQSAQSLASATEMLPTVADSIEPMQTAQSVEPMPTAQSIEPMPTAQGIEQNAPMQNAPMQTAPSIEPAQSATLNGKRQQVADLVNAGMPVQDAWRVVNTVDLKTNSNPRSDLNRYGISHNENSGNVLNHNEEAASQTPFMAAAQPTSIDLSTRAKGLASLNSMPVTTPAEASAFIKAHSAFANAYKATPKNISAKLETAKSIMQTAPVPVTSTTEAIHPVAVKHQSSEVPVQTAQSIEQISQKLPGFAKKLQDKLVVVPNTEAAKQYASGELSSTVQGFYSPKHDKVIIIANMASSKENLMMVLNHELLHRAEFVDPDVKATMKRLDDQFEKRFELAKLGKGTDIERRAYQRVKNSSSGEDMSLAEFRAYLVSEYNRNPNSLTGYVKKLVQDFIAAIRIGLMRAGVNLKELTAADMNRIAETYGAQAKSEPAKSEPAKSEPANDTNVADLYSDMQAAGDTWLKEHISNAKRDKAIYALQDRYIDLKRQIERIRNTGEAIPESEDAYQAEELFHQRQASRIKDFYDNELNPILIALHDADISIEQFEAYLHARHAPSRNKVMAERNPNQAQIDKNLNKAVRRLAEIQKTATPKELSEATREVEKWKKAQPFTGTEEQRLSLSGMTDADAAKIIRDVPTAKRSTYEALGAKIDAITDRTHQLLVDYGMETEQGAKQLKGEWDHYVPLYRDEAHLDSAGHPQGQGFSVRGSGIKSATGSNEKVTNILAHIAASREQMIKRGEKNRVTAALANFIKAHPDAEFAEVGRIPTREVIENGIVKTEPVPMYMNADNVVVMRVRGKDIGIVFNQDKPESVRLALSLKNMDGSEMDMLESAVASATRFMAKMSTQYNVVFGIINAMRDTQSVMLNLSTTELRGKQRQVMGKMLDSSKTIWAVERGSAGGDPAMRKLYDRFNKAGGTTGFTQMFGDIAERQKSIKKEFANLDKLTAANAHRKVVLAVGKWLTDYNTLMENSARFATFQVGIEAGLSDAKAASIAKNISVNFNRKGAITTKVGAYFAFFNAAVQGTARTVETLRGPKGKQIIAYGIGIGAAMTAMAIAAMGEDDWEKIPEFVRERSLIIPLGDADYVSIPMPLGFHILPNIGRKAVEIAMGAKQISKTERLMQLLGSTVSAFNPLGGNGVDSFVPTVLDPVVALWRNKDWTGRAIYKEDFNSLKPTPGFTRKKDTASGISTTLAELINKATGGTDYKKGIMSPTPDQLDYAFAVAFGGTGRELLKLEQSSEAFLTGNLAELPAHKIPLIGRLYGKAEGPSVERGLYYENLKRLNEHEAEITGLRSEQGGAAKAAKYIRETPEARLVQRGKAIEKIINGLMRRRKELKAKNPNAPGLKLLEKRIADQQKRLNDLVAAAA